LPTMMITTERWMLFGFALAVTDNFMLTSSVRKKVVIDLL